LYTDIATEQEAAIGLLLCSGSSQTIGLSQASIETISRILVLCTRFRGSDNNEAFRKVFAIAMESKREDFVLYCASLITEEFADTLFCMCCETALAEGRWDDAYGERLATIGVALQLDSEEIKSIIKTYIIRTRWNVEVVG
jgi:hypothetical protein